MSRPASTLKHLEWVAISPDIADDDRVFAMAVTLGVSRFDLAGRMPRVFARVAAVDAHGSIASIADAMLDAWAYDLAGFGAQFRAVMCDELGQIRSWDRYNGAAFKKLLHERERKAKWRAEQAAEAAAKKARKGGVPSVSRDNDGTGDGTGRGLETGQSSDADGDNRGTETGREPGPSGAYSDSDSNRTTPATDTHRVREALAEILDDVRRPLSKRAEFCLLEIAAKLPETSLPALALVVGSSPERPGAIQSMWQMLDPADGTTGPEGHPVTAKELAAGLQANMTIAGGYNAPMIRKTIQGLRAGVPTPPSMHGRPRRGAPEPAPVTPLRRVGRPVPEGESPELDPSL